MKHSTVFCLFLYLVAFAAAAAPRKLEDVLNEIRCTILAIIPMVSLLMFVLAGFAYMFGQYFGAEIRARAISYSTSLIVGAIVAFLIVQFSNIVITAMFNVELPACPT